MASTDQFFWPHPDTPVRVYHGVAQVLGCDAMLVDDGVAVSSCRRRHYDAKPHSHIEHLVQLRLADPPTRLNQVKYWLRLR
jgi:hypothetical protein